MQIINGMNRRLIDIDGEGSIFKNKEHIRRLNRWFQEVIVGGYDVRLSEFQDNAEAIAAQMPGDRKSATYCRCFTPEELSFVVNGGLESIHLLIKHVNDSTETRWTYFHPSSSYIADRKWLVGEIACYLIEAIIRKERYFSYSGKLLYACSEENSLARAARAYVEWYKRCFHPNTGEFNCPAADLPGVPWDYCASPCDWQDDRDLRN